MEIRKTQLLPDNYYHIYNRGINGQDVFFEERNYRYFLEKYLKFVHPFVKTYSYCLLKNHYHFLIKVREEEELWQNIHKNKDKSISWHVSNSFSSFLKGYTQGVNKTYSRSGTLFEEPFKRIEVENDDHFSYLLAYIHLNPVKHGIANDYENYLHSSYRSNLSASMTKICRDEILNWFGGKEEYVAYHKTQLHCFLKNEWKNIP